jgi:hypothetical protein
MKPEQSEGTWLDPHIRALLEEGDAQLAKNDGVRSAVFGIGAMKHIGGQGLLYDLVPVLYLYQL